MKKQEKICIINGQGMVGLAFKRIFKEAGYFNIIATDEYINLFDNVEIKDFFQKEKPDYVLFPSYKSGSIQANINYPAEFIYENLIVQNNIIHNAYLSGVKKMLFLGASCVYPKNSPQPIKEEYLLSGELEKTSQPYAVAKISGIEMCRAYNKQYGTKFISVIPATLYGPNDKFNAENSHVLSGLIRKFHEAKIKGEKEILLWGTGAPRREFIYIDNFAEACVFLMNNDFEVDLINIGSGEDFEIKELAEKVKNIVGFNGKIVWDTTKSDGVMKKLLDSSLIKNLGWRHNINIDDGIKKTHQWFVENIEKL